MTGGIALVGGLARFWPWIWYRSGMGGCDFARHLIMEYNTLYLSLRLAGFN